MSDDVESWLQTLPLETPVTIDGESVFLRVGRSGAELGVILFPAPTDAQLIDAARVGFQSAMQYEAGLGFSDEPDAAVLSQWLPHAGNWTDAAQALEALLNQTALFRVALGRAAPKAAPEISPQERRIRAMMTGQR
ncbi:MAG: hypothetical protein ACRYGK_00850 [Janthinobacterium lividum]